MANKAQFKHLFTYPLHVHHLDLLTKWTWRFRHKRQHAVEGGGHSSVGTRKKSLGQEWKGKTLWRDLRLGLDGRLPSMHSTQPQLSLQEGPSLPKHDEVFLLVEKKSHPPLALQLTG